ncbi:hypothetical protein BXY51_008943 [Actinoplanes cyaneus]|nr:hypothetical protein [Actinoplanes cyaneus]
MVAYDEARDAACFEPVVAAVEDLAAGVMVLRPGACAVAARPGTTAASTSCRRP